ncbi:MAG: hypothetical protein B193_0630, partial [Solidesulfovibrio magneticus str. Maddingley MBC34]
MTARARARGNGIAERFVRILK